MTNSHTETTALLMAGYKAARSLQRMRFEMLTRRLDAAKGAAYTSATGAIADTEALASMVDAWNDTATAALDEALAAIERCAEAGRRWPLDRNRNARERKHIEDARIALVQALADDRRDSLRDAARKRLDDPLFKYLSIRRGRQKSFSATDRWIAGRIDFGAQRIAVDAVEAYADEYGKWEADARAALRMADERLKNLDGIDEADRREAATEHENFVRAEMALAIDHWRGLVDTMVGDGGGFDDLEADVTLALARETAAMAVRATISGGDPAMPEEIGIEDDPGDIDSMISHIVVLDSNIRRLAA